MNKIHSREILLYIGIRGSEWGYNPIVDTKPLILQVPGNKTNEEVHDFMCKLFQKLIDEVAGVPLPENESKIDADENVSDLNMSDLNVSDNK